MLTLELFQDPTKGPGTAHARWQNRGHRECEPARLTVRRVWILAEDDSSNLGQGRHLERSKDLVSSRVDRRLPGSPGGREELPKLATLALA